MLDVLVLLVLLGVLRAAKLHSKQLGQQNLLEFSFYVSRIKRLISILLFESL